MPTRRVPQSLPERVAEIEEQVRRIHGNVATTPVITDYAALDGVPSDLATIGDVNTAVGPVAAHVADIEMLLWLGGPT